MKIKNCRVCFSSNLEVSIDLGLQPWCNDFVLRNEVGDEKKYPLMLAFCHKCSTLQVDYTVPKEIMYIDHTYLSGMTRTIKDHFQKISNNVVNSLLKSKGLVVDIGSNDGTLLKTYKSLGMEVIGIEPGEEPSKIALKNSIPTEKKFFDYDCAINILNNKGKAKVISAANVFYHVEELHSIVKGIKYLLDDDGVIVIQASYLPQIIEKKAFDIMYHEHLLYYRVENLNYLFNLYDLEIFDFEMAPVHGGSIIAYSGHKGKNIINKKVDEMIEYEQSQEYHNVNTYKQFNNNIMELRDKLLELISSLKENGNTIYAYGAPAKGTVLLNYCGLNRDVIDLAVEVNPLKFGRYIPCTNIPIVDETTVDEPDYYLLLSWNFAEEFFRNEAYQSGKRKFIVPLPEPRIYSK